MYKQLKNKKEIKETILWDFNMIKQLINKDKKQGKTEIIILKKIQIVINKIKTEN